jgi:hypothetical protein
MLQTLIEYKEEISLLPAGVKIAFSTLLLFAIGFAVYYGVGNFIADARVRHLESQNFELNRTAQSAQEKAAKAETNAANEAVRAATIETQLTALKAKTSQSDEKYKIQSQKSSNLRLSLNRVRQSQPANTSTAELERKLADRYGPAKRSQ